MASLFPVVGHWADLELIQPTEWSDFTLPLKCPAHEYVGVGFTWRDRPFAWQEETRAYCFFFADGSAKATHATATVV